MRLTLCFSKMWLLSFCVLLMFVLSISLSLQFISVSYCFLFYPYFPFAYISPPFSTQTSWVSPKPFANCPPPLLLLLAPCPIRALSCPRGCVVRECQLHFAESKLEAASNRGSEWWIGRLWAEIPESFWGWRWRAGPGCEWASYPGPGGADIVRGAGEMELVQHQRGSLQCRGGRTQQPCGDLQN